VGDLAARRHLLVSARAEFLERADADLRGVPDHVVASWRRSVASGVHPGVVTTEYHADLDVGSRLVRCALPVIEQLAEQIAGIPTCVALTDDRARLLVRRDSSPWSGRIADRLYFAQGFGYAEGTVGTNGVGTVLEFGESVHIVGAEHFVESLQPYACAGAPIRDPFTGRIEGVLDISCLSEDSSPILHSLVRSAAARIQQNLLTDRNQQQQALFDAYARVDGRGRRAVLAVGPRTVMANSPMQTLLDAGDMVALQDHVRFVMLRHARVDGRIDLPSGARVRLRGSTVTAGGGVAGMVAVVSVLNEIDGHAGQLARALRAADSRSPAWRSAAATVARALRAGSPVLVIGEAGSGRFTILSELHRRIHGTGRVAGIEFEQVESAPAEVAARILRPESLPVLHVLRDVDRLSAAAVAAFLAELGDGVAPSIAATAARPAHDALLALFRTSAAVPPLRNRTGDVPALVDALLAELAAGRDVRLSPEALRLVARYDWPGNVRQLRDALAHALRRRPVGRIEAADLPEFCQSAPRGSLRPVDQVERDAIVNALRDAGGNRVAAAAALGLARSTLYRKIRQYGITV
jgi:transcriptional regulator of acetoin/glycerol metabolism